VSIQAGKVVVVEEERERVGWKRVFGRWAGFMIFVGIWGGSEEI